MSETYDPRGGLNTTDWESLQDWKPEDIDPEVSTNPPESNSGYDDNQPVELEDERY